MWGLHHPTTSRSHTGRVGKSATHHASIAPPGEELELPRGDLQGTWVSTNPQNNLRLAVPDTFALPPTIHGSYGRV